jgi:hypothetical protein
VTGALRPPPQRPRLKEGEVDREEKLSESQLAGRDRVIRQLLFIVGVTVYSGFVFLLREFLPGGGYPWPFSMIPSLLLWPIVLGLGVLAAHDPAKRRTLLLALTVLLGVSVVGSVWTFLFKPMVF